MTLFSNGGRPLALRPDSELEQAGIRVAIVAAILCYHVLTHIGNMATSTPSMRVILAYLLFSVALAVTVWRRPGPASGRRILGIIGDQGVCALLLYLGGEVAAVFLFVPLWVSVGNGLRFGQKYLYFSSTLAVLGMSVLSVSASPWKDQHFVSVGLILANLAVPAYVAALLRRLERAHEQLGKQAVQLEHLALHDSLTELANRVMFFDLLRKAVARVDRGGTPIALFYFDLDGFKSVNDQHGHDVGDELLREIAKRLQMHTRDGDTLARLGGDEFALLVEDQRTSGALERYTQLIMETPMAIESVKGYSISVTASLGVVQYANCHASPCECDANALLAHADQLMYRAKKIGPGKVVVEQHSSWKVCMK